jgi:AcrR family transcriptional regulator
MASSSARSDAPQRVLTDEELIAAAVSDGALGLAGDTSARRSKVGRILEAAASVFARRGFNEARMDEVADAAGVSKGGLYLHFPSKDALLEGLVGYLVGLETRRLDAARNAEGPVADRLATFFHEYAKDMQAMARFYPLIMEVYARSSRSANLRRLLQRFLNRFVAEVAVLTQAGIDSGEFRRVDPQDVALQLLSLFEGLALVWAIDPERLAIPEVGDRGVRLILDGLLVRPAPDGPAAAGGSVGNESVGS